MSKKDEFLYDVRIAERNIRDGRVSRKEYEKYLKDLPDSEDKSEPLIIEDEEGGEELELSQDEVEEEETE